MEWAWPLALKAELVKLMNVVHLNICDGHRDRFATGLQNCFVGMRLQNRNYETQDHTEHINAEK